MFPISSFRISRTNSIKLYNAFKEWSFLKEMVNVASFCLAFIIKGSIEYWLSPYYKQIISNLIVEFKEKWKGEFCYLCKRRKSDCLFLP